MSEVTFMDEPGLPEFKEEFKKEGLTDDEVNQSIEILKNTEQFILT